jgi:hypothetical protein
MQGPMVLNKGRMGRRCHRGALGAIGFLFSSAGAAEAAETAPEPAPLQAWRGAVLVDQRFAFGVDRVAGMSLEIDGIGMRFQLAPTLEAHAAALGLITAGTAELGPPARSGWGGELGLRLSPWPTWSVRPYVYTGLGLLLFPRRPFLPGGDVYEGLVSFGVGADVPLDDRWSVGVKGFAAHLSNGQGLGPHNPAYDGYGAGLELKYAVLRGEPSKSPWADAPPHGAGGSARAGYAPGFSIDAEAGRVGDAALLAARLRGAERISDAVIAVLDTEIGTLAEEPVAEIGLAVVGHLGWASLGVHGGYRRYAGIDTALATAQLEAHATQELSFVAMAHHERARGFEDLWRAAIGGRLFPLPSVVLEVGVGFDRLGQANTFQNDHADPYFAAEWAMPFSSKEWQLSLFLDRQISTVDTVGLRFAYGMGEHLRDAARRDGWRRLR